MANNINWMGNPVVDANVSRQANQKMPYQNAVSQNMQRMPQGDVQGAMDMGQEGPPRISEPGYLPNYLQKNIGRNMRAEFIINNAYIDKVGKLVEVGINYFVLDDPNTRSFVVCDLYSVKFVNILE